MEFVKFQQTYSAQSKTDPTLRIYNGKIYYLWNERDINNVGQVWFASSNIDGSDFVEMQLTNGLKSMNEPELYIYNNIIYMTWWGVEEVTGKYQVWITSMNPDGSDHKLIYVTDTVFGAKYPKIAVKNNEIYLAYQQRFLDYDYYHMVRAKINIDGTNFVSYTASSSPNETVRDVHLFVTDDPGDNNIYYIWTRQFPIDGTLYLYLCSANNDLLDFTNIMVIPDSESVNLYVKDDKIYFAWVSYTYNDARFSVINTDGTGYIDILTNDDHSYSSFQVTTDINGNDIIYFAYSIKTSSDFPVKRYQLLSAVADISNLEYTETELVSEITISFNDTVNLQVFISDNTLHYIWQQYDENNKYQIWIGISSEDDPCAGVICPDTCIGYDRWGQECDLDTGLCVVDRFIESQSESCDYEPSKLWLYLLLALPPVAIISSRVVGEAKKRQR